VIYRDLEFSLFYFGQIVVFICDPSIVVRDIYTKPCVKCEFRLALGWFYVGLCWPCLEIVFRFIIEYSSSLRDFGL
jgi:hypothetical protein